jgi:hypothetical protein
MHCHCYFISNRTQTHTHTHALTTNVNTGVDLVGAAGRTVDAEDGVGVVGLM